MALLLTALESGPRAPFVDHGLAGFESPPCGHEMLPRQRLECNFYFSEHFLMGHLPSVNDRMLNSAASGGLS
jgi:hypothetical protein